MSDLAEIKTGNRVIEIAHPATGDPLGVRVTLVSVDDDRLTKVKRDITNKQLTLQQRNKHLKADDIEDNWLTILFSTMVDWEWYEQKEVRDETGVVTPFREQPTFNGEVPDFNRRNALAILKSLPWFAKQINEAIDETKEFFTVSE